MDELAALDAIAGVAGFESVGVTGGSESIADRAGDGGSILWLPAEGMAIRGEGAMIGDRVLCVMTFMGEDGWISGLCDAAAFASAMSTSTVLSLPRSMQTAFGSGGESDPMTPVRSS